MGDYLEKTSVEGEVGKKERKNKDKELFFRKQLLLYLEEKLVEGKSWRAELGMKMLCWLTD